MKPLTIVLESERLNELVEMYDSITLRIHKANITHCQVVCWSDGFDTKTTSPDWIVVTKAPSVEHWNVLIQQYSDRIKWVHSLMAGVDRLIPFVKGLDHSTVLTNARGAFSDSLAEYALAAILYFNKQISRLESNRVSRVWDKFRMNTIAGKTVGLLGYGNVGRSCGRLCKALSMRVIACRRTPTEVRSDDIADAIMLSSDPIESTQFYSACDYVICSLPSTAETRKSIDASIFSQMKKSCVFISIGRGDVLDEAALVDALTSGTIAGAALDVFEVEPLPKESPLWSLPNCLVSSHNADWVETYFEDSMEIFESNLNRFISNQPLMNIVDVSRGY